MKYAVLCSFLLSACLAENPPPKPVEYALTWICQSPDGCERGDEVSRIDRVVEDQYSYHFTSTQEPSLSADAEFIPSDSLPPGCDWLYNLSLFGHELRPSRICYSAATFELQLAIPNQDPTTSSMWLVEARDVEVFDPSAAADVVVPEVSVGFMPYICSLGGLCRSMNSHAMTMSEESTTPMTCWIVGPSSITCSIARPSSRSTATAYRSHT